MAVWDQFTSGNKADKHKKAKEDEAKEKMAHEAEKRRLEKEAKKNRGQLKRMNALKKEGRGDGTGGSSDESFTSDSTDSQGVNDGNTKTYKTKK